MANGSIRIHSKTEYTIEVNDQGETITFDLADAGLSTRLFKMYEEIDKVIAECTARAAEIDARPDEPLRISTRVNQETGAEEEKTVFTKNQYDGSQMMAKFYADARRALDMFLGAGACQKIFGDRNYDTMFTDLLEQLEPEFKKMGLSIEKARKKNLEKYRPNREQRRALK